MSYSDDQLRQAVDAVFTKYDKDKSGTLESNQLEQLVREVFTHLNRASTAEQMKKHVQSVINSVDQNKDGKVTKVQLFEIFKRVSSK